MLVSSPGARGSPIQPILSALGLWPDHQGDCILPLIRRALLAAAENKHEPHLRAQMFVCLGARLSRYGCARVGNVPRGVQIEIESSYETIMPLFRNFCSRACIGAKQQVRGKSFLQKG